MGARVSKIAATTSVKITKPRKHIPRNMQDYNKYRKVATVEERRQPIVPGGDGVGGAGAEGE